MSCLIKDGKYYDNKGNESKLYRDLVDKVGELQAHELFVLAQTPTFKSQNASSKIPILDFIKGKYSNQYEEYKGFFSKETTGTSLDDIFDDNIDGQIGYHYFYKKEKARITFISPSEYLKRVREGFNSVLDENLTPQSRQNILNGIEKGDKINMPFLDYRNNRFSQEGRNRAKLAEELGEKLIPVLIVSDVSNRDLQSVSEDMIETLTDVFYFSDKKDLKKALKDNFNLHRDALAYIDNNVLENVSLTKVNKNKTVYKDDDLLINIEPTAQEVIDYAQDNFALAEPLTAEEILDLSTLQIEDVENSEDLYTVLYNAFYKDNLFSPQVKQLKKIYTETELTNILENSDIQARIKETIEKLRFTEPFEIQQIPKDNDYGYNDLVVNIIGQYKSNNPIQDRELSEPQGTEVEVIGEDGQPIENQLIYDNAVKVVDNPKIYDAIDAIIAAPQEIKTDKVEKRVINWLKNYGLDISKLTRNNYTKLKTFLLSPTKENTIALEESLGFTRSPKKEYYNIETPLDRTYQALRTTKTEQELFDELSLIKTNTPNVYHKIEKIDEQEMRNIMKNQDLTVPLYELYKEYFGYGISFETQRIKEKTIADKTFMKAPNGKPTNLSEENWLFVRTKAFRSWFGDFENDPENSSKVVDENGEPLVVYHGTQAKNFNEFKTTDDGIHFGTLQQTEWFNPTRVYGVFLNARNIKSIEDRDSVIERRVRESNIIVNSQQDIQPFIDSTPKAKEVLGDTYDGGIYINVYEGDKNSESYVVLNPNQIKSAENIRLQIDRDSNDIRYFKRNSPQERIVTNIEGVNNYIDYLTTEFVADFAAQKIKNKDNDFYNQFKITEKGVELISQDEITLQKVKSQIANHPQLADYSLLSKNLPNLKEDNPLRIQTKQDRRIQAANNIQALPTPSSQITILDENYLEALNETAEFLRVGDDIYEQKEKGVYGRLQFEKNPNYFTFNIEAPPLKEIEVKNTISEATKVKKLTDNQTKDENFGCL